MSRGVEPIFVTRQETIALPKAEPTMAECVLMAVRMKYNEPKFNQQNGRIVKGVPRDWNRGIRTMNKVPRPNSPCCTYCH
jgi:hypothetical protein